MQHELTAPALTQAAEGEPLRPKDIAAALRVETTTIYREITAGRLDAYRVGSGRGTFRVSRAAFAQYLADRGIPTSELAVTL
ncbi:helix-turn-helix domain-containing protein [Streptomyces sp. NBC_00140]|uniref:helix-turn-helix domain-containing protein n=1 Tax=Streptomyces sp. NBC_00140 TaxID=2975664 RepID=UPI0022518D27|nr:helix-turn-helix domain-containing protein [Streptomyces sp. NBC_00140]MCX5338121.1 helix-turn-helix domain-containing protein [Streptomyces sp. NBC_00140]